MRKGAALLITCLVLLLIAGNYFIFTAGEPKPDRISAQVIRSIDGDTLETDKGTVRLLNINTPERKEAYYEEARSFMGQFANQSVELEITGNEKYGRLLGRVYAPDYVNLVLVKEGLAHIFLVEESELTSFVNAQKSAQASQKGMWRHSLYYGCIKASIDSHKEVVSLIKLCDVNVVGWTLKDETTNTYSFSNDFSESITLYSAKGTNSESSLYWGRGSAWNDDRDSIFIRDTKGTLVYFDQYGYP